MQPLWKIVWQFLKRLTVVLSFDAAVHSQVFTDTGEMKTETCTQMLTEALLITATRWKQPR